MIHVTEYNHVGIVIRNLEECMKFYGEVLGLRSIPRPQFNFPGHWYQVGPGAQLHLMVLEETIPMTMRHIALEVEDIDKAQEYLESKGVEVSRAQPASGPSMPAEIRDPDGLSIELVQRG